MVRYHFGKHKRLRVRHPDFLSSLLALANFMRPSFLKCRTCQLLWRLVQEIRVALRFFPAGIGSAKLQKSLPSTLPPPRAAVRATPPGPEQLHISDLGIWSRMDAEAA
jgi:hypothetical protein